MFLDCQCVSLRIQASRGKPYDPKLKISEDTIPYIGDSTFNFHRAPVCIHGTEMQAREGLVEKLQMMSLLEKIDTALVTRQQKLQLFKQAIYVNHFVLSWLETKLQPIATRYLKKWCGLAKSADTGCMFLLKMHGGIPTMTAITYHHLHETANRQGYCLLLLKRLLG